MTDTASGLAQHKLLDELYADFEDAGLIPLWNQRDDLMPTSPQPAAVPHLWPWARLLPIAERSGRLVPVGRGGERRAMALSNPGLPGLPYATPTLWAAIQYLGPREVAPSHRHSQGAFRFVVDGEGVWTNVDGDAVAMRRGDLLLTPSWAFHEHQNVTDEPMTWIDGLDIPLVSQLDAGFFEFGPDELSTRATPERSRGERLWAHPGLRPISRPDRRNSPLAAYRWEHTDAALTAQLELESEGVAGVIEPGHAGVRFSNPTTGKDALVTMRTEMRRLRAGARTTPARTVGSAIWQVFEGAATAHVGDRVFDIAEGDLFAVLSWCEVALTARTEVDLFRFSDEPVYEALGLARTHRGEQK
ncbi:cupin domain-containing protein [Streptomyces caniscabiei]|uniref:Cupin domain-containing protein n=1 Tax=Streptomyces caniscabiei TaxID=2746961 RepID=A0ABU4N4A8_9ACTN|nr:cupin domain-containing protein [Streptomyces caniscabiei]MBE4734010.1 cupin domain-containing protein [Streptomyces caniscabiei]MBE4761425.1 cupin domain-containing protein [Streptomyces caniscabiei]MBE4782505.1 cupin domain-containing protein [Streptomyces caniscabiei]MBE4791808.1 cupin domain-containing protein [Streptomyces caniscabiei]MDX2948849.1 cupin domain-containing protein [Streptomyces caniscabiei]